LPYIEKGIYDSGLGFTPVNQGDWIMVKVPPMTEERRKELVKVVKKELEEAKIRVRQIRHDFLKDIKAMFENKEITEDEKKQYEKQLDDTIKDYNKKLEDIAKLKEQEILKI
jgi:ribosome recycling factor